MKTLTEPRLTSPQLARVREDYSRVSEKIIDILTGEQRNFIVASPGEYLSPTVTSIEVPLDSRGGELYHYQTIRSALEKVTMGKEVEYEESLRLFGAPQEIKGAITKPLKTPTTF